MFFHHTISLYYYVVSKAAAYDVLISETYPANVTFLDANPAPTSGDNIWDLGALLVGDSGTIYINVSIDMTAPDSIILTNTVDATWTDGGQWPAGDTSTDTSTTVVVVPEFGLGPLSGILIMGGIFVLGRRKFKILNS